MAKKAKLTISASERTLGLGMDVKAAELAKQVAPLVMTDIEELIKHKQEWEGGRFKVMFRLTDNLTPEQLDALPDPKAETGQNPAHYKVAVIQDGKEKVQKHYFYEEMAYDFPANRLKLQRIGQLKRSMMDPAKVNTTDIGKDILDMPHDNRIAEISRLNDEINSTVGPVVAAFELFFQFKRFAELPFCTAYPIFKVGPDGLPLDGNDGRSREIEVTKTPIVITTKIENRKSIDTKRVGIGTFLRYDVAKAMENKGTYQAVLDTVKREKPDDETGNQNQGNQAVPQLVNTADTFLARATDMYEFGDRTMDERTGATLEALKKATHGPGSDDNFTACRGLLEFLKDIVGSPADDVRYQALINADNAAAA